MKKNNLIILFLLLSLMVPIIINSQVKSTDEEPLMLNNLSGKKGRQIVLALISNPKTFNPLFASQEQASSFITNMMFDGLVRINSKTQEIEPALAKEWKVSPNGKEWIFYLRKGAKWSDGLPITCDDVIFTLDTIYHPSINTPSKDILQINQKNLKAIKLDTYTVKFILPQIYSPFLRQVEKNTFPILPKHKWEKYVQNGTFLLEMNINSNPQDIITSGPYMLEKYIPGQRVILKANPFYYKLDKNNLKLPYFNKMIINIISDYNSIYLKLISGEIDLWDSLRPEDYSLLKTKAKEKNLEIKIIGVSPGPEMLWFNLSNELNPKTKKKYIDEKKLKWFNNINFRKAIAYAIDRAAIIKNIYYQSAKPSYGLETESNQLWYNPNITSYIYDINKAKDYLAKAGFKLLKESDRLKLIDSEGNEVKFTLNTNSENASRVNAANFIASDLKKIGITVNVQPIEFRSFVTKLMDTFDYDAALLAFTRPDLDPSSTMNVLLSSSSMHVWHPNQKIPSTEWEKRIDDLLNLQLITYDYNLRKKYYLEIQKIMDDNLPIIYLYAPLAISVYKKNIKNIQCSILEPRCTWNIEELSL